MISSTFLFHLSILTKTRHWFELRLSDWPVDHTENVLCKFALRSSVTTGPLGNRVLTTLSTSSLISVFSERIVDLGSRIGRNMDISVKHFWILRQHFRRSRAHAILVIMSFYSPLLVVHIFIYLCIYRDRPFTVRTIFKDWSAGKLNCLRGEATCESNSTETTY